MEVGFYHPVRGYWQAVGQSGAVDMSAFPDGTVEVPVRPSPEHEWTGTEWVASPVDVVAWRETASVSRIEFCTALLSAGVLTVDEAIAASKGDWPVTFAGALDMLPVAERASAQMHWAQADPIHRNHDLIALLATFTQLSDTQVDALFGWQA